MAADKKIKVVFQGIDVVNQHSFNVVKIGEIPISEEGIITGLRLGILDKSSDPAEEVPFFELMYSKCISDTVTPSLRTFVYVFVLREYVEGPEGYETYLSGSATFTQRQKRTWKSPSHEAKS